jgi:hypothetical protein
VPKNLCPGFYKIISTDYLAQNFFVMIFAGWIIYAIDSAFEGKSTFFLAIFAILLTPLGLLTFFLRYRLIKSVFENGKEISGLVTKVSSIANDLIIQYEYNFSGQKYQYRNRVKKNTYAQTLKQGQQEILLAQVNNPNIAFIKNIYLENIQKNDSI